MTSKMIENVTSAQMRYGDVRISRQTGEPMWELIGKYPRSKFPSDVQALVRRPDGDLEILILMLGDKFTVRRDERLFVKENKSRVSDYVFTKNGPPDLRKDTQDKLEEIAPHITVTSDHLWLTRPVEQKPENRLVSTPLSPADIEKMYEALARRGLDETRTRPDSP